MREKLVTGALLLSESAWLVALLGILSFPFGATGSPMSWLAVLAVMSVSLVWARTLSMIVMPNLMAYALQMLAGIVVIFLTVASQVSPETGALDLGWIGTIISGDAPESFTLRSIYGSIGGAALWWRGGHIGAADIPAESLSSSFRIGILILAIAAVIDIIHSADLDVFPMMFIFFASGVAGLIVAHMAPTSRQGSGARAWTRVIGGMVGVLVVLGFLFSLLQEDALAAIAAPILWVLQMLSVVVFYIVIFPLAYIIDFVTRGIFALLLWLGGEPQPDRALAAPQGTGVLEGLARNGEAEPAALLLLQVLQWSLVAAIVIGVLALMALAFKRRVRNRAESAEGQRESVLEDADVPYDFANLLFNMLPSRFRRRSASPILHVPSDDPDITDVFRIYFGMLTLAEKRGYTRQSSETPNEFRQTLERVLPQELVRAATTAFTRACYGHHAAPRDQIDQMRRELERAASEKT